MTRAERENWIVNIENSAWFIEKEIGIPIVNGILARYGASNIEHLQSEILPDVFSELYAIEAEIR